MLLWAGFSTFPGGALGFALVKAGFGKTTLHSAGIYGLLLFTVLCYLAKLC